MDIVFLGTSSMVPTAERNHVSFYLQTKSFSAIFDCGEGTQRQIRFAGIKPRTISYLFLTHWHGDHSLGVPGLIQMLSANNKEELTIIGPKGTAERIKNIMNTFEFKSSIKLIVKEVKDKDKIKIKDYTVEVRQVKHSTLTLAYKVVEDKKVKIDKTKVKQFNLEGPILKKIQQKKDIKLGNKTIHWKDIANEVEGESLAYITDTAYDKRLKGFAGADVAIIEATYLNRDKEKAKEYLHLCIEQSLDIGERARNVILTHFSQRYKDHEIEEELKEELKKSSRKKRVFIAKDFSRFRLKNGELVQINEQR